MPAHPLFSRRPRAPKPLDPLPKLNFHIMKEGELRRKLKGYGLQTTGAKQALVERYKALSVKVKSAIDAGKMVSYEELAGQVTREEQQRSRAANHPNHGGVGSGAGAGAGGGRGEAPGPGKGEEVAGAGAFSASFLS